MDACVNCAADTGKAEIIKKKEVVCPVVGRGRSAGVQEQSGKACLCQGHVETEAQAEGRLPGPTAGLRGRMWLEPSDTGGRKRRSEQIRSGDR